MLTGQKIPACPASIRQSWLCFSPWPPREAEKKQNELLPFLMAAASTAKQEGKQFTAEEMDLIAEVLKSGKTPEETAQIDKMMHLMKMLKKQY